MHIKKLIYGACGTFFIFMQVFLSGCPGKQEPPEEETQAEHPAYILERFHADDTNALKQNFFSESFVNLDGETVTINSFAGTPLIIAMYVSFLTDDGHNCLLGLEALQRVKSGEFTALILPMESAEKVKPAINTQLAGNIQFLFHEGDSSNLQMLDEYRQLYWDEKIIRNDFPDDPVNMHLTSPFYWVVDRNGTIREKLIDYSNRTGIDVRDLSEVLEALLVESGSIGGDGS